MMRRQITLKLDEDAAEWLVSVCGSTRKQGEYLSGLLQRDKLYHDVAGKLKQDFYETVISLHELTGQLVGLIDLPTAPIARRAPTPSDEDTPNVTP